MVDTIAYFSKKQELAQFLNENPHMRPMQSKIDQLMASAGNSQNRMALLSQLMSKSVKDLADGLEHLSKIMPK